MCVVSMIMEHYCDRWGPRIMPPVIVPSMPFTPIQPPAITPEEIEEFRKLLARAREYDKRNNEPDCEMQQKKDALLGIADKLGIKITFDEAQP